MTRIAWQLGRAARWLRMYRRDLVEMAGGVVVFGLTLGLIYLMLVAFA